MSKVRYSTFLNNIYYEQFLVLYKSYLYYNHEYPFRVYDYNSLDEQKVAHLKEIGVEVIVVNKGDYSDMMYYHQYGFKWKGLLESDCDVEVLLDCDTIFLDNLDDLIEKVKDYELVVVPEYVSNHRAGNLFNIGLMVFKKESKYLLEKSIQRLKDEPYKNGTKDWNNTEMFSLCDIVEEDNINVLELDWKQYMHLWHNHNLKKTLEIQDGKFVIKNEDGSRVRFYHFTTHIDPYNGGNTILRFAYDYETTNRMWVKRFNNPVGLIYNHLSQCENYETILEKQNEWKIK